MSVLVAAGKSCCNALTAITEREQWDMDSEKIKEFSNLSCLTVYDYSVPSIFILC